MASDGTGVDPDGFYRPKSEADIVQLVKKAYAEGKQIRCRGSVHSVAHAIYTDPGPGDPNVPNKVSVQSPPEGPNLNLLLDDYAGLAWIDEARGVVEVDAGLHLGADPNAPDQNASLKDSLLYQAFEKGWTLRDLGGITHQTISGFIATGSSGGSLQYGIDKNIVAFRVIDGTGEVLWVDEETNADLFFALGTSMGLLGIISKVRLKLTPTFNVYGQEATTKTAVEECPVDLFNVGCDGKPNLRQFLETTPYARILWWPQQGAERAVFWQAVAGPPLDAFTPLPYIEWTGSPLENTVEQLAASIFYTLVGNLDDLKAVPGKLKDDFEVFDDAIALLLKQLGLGKLASEVLAKILTGALEGLTDAAILLLQDELRTILPKAFPKLIDLFQPLSGDKPKVFMDYAWRSLPMDNAVNDTLLNTEFTEIWIPLEYTERTMQLLASYFEEGGTQATGFFSTELYSAKESKFWLSPSFGGPVFRVDPFWFADNAGDPAAKGGFFDGFWRLLRDNDVPFRLHWGKFLPEYDFADWAAYLRSQYPRWDDFMTLRKQRDPKDIFLTDYWRRHLLGET